MRKWAKVMGIVLAFAACLVPAANFPAHAESIIPAAETAKDQLSRISGEEQDTLEELFALSTQIKRITAQINQTNLAIEKLRSDIDGKESLIDGETLRYETIKANLAGVLKVQQRAGAAYNIEILLGAADLKDLIHRINLLRDLSKNTAELMESIETARAGLAKEEQQLAVMMMTLEEQQKGLKASYVRENNARLELDKKLDSLKTEKAYYEGYLLTLEKEWGSLKPLFSDTIRSFTRIIETGALPENTVEMTDFMFYATGTIQQDKFNGILTKREDLPELKFGLYHDKVTLEFPANRLLLEGNFELVNTHTIQYAAASGTFYGVPLSQSTLLDLFKEEKLIFSLKPLIGNNVIKRIDNHEGSIELLITGS